MRKSFTYEGQRYYIRCENEREFELKKSLKIRDIDNNTRMIKKNVSVAKWCDGWVDTYRVNSAEKNKKHCRLLLKRFCDKYGKYPVNKITQLNIQNYINSLQGSSKEMQKKNVWLLKTLFQTAYENDLIYKNPVASISLPPSKAVQSRRSLTEYEKQILLKVASYHYGGLYIKIMLYCGLRTMEVAPLIGKDIDLEKRLLNVNKAIKTDGTIGPPKTENGNRVVPIPDVLIPDLQGITPFEPVCKTNTGKPYNHNAVEKMWRSFKECMNIETNPMKLDFVMYDLRHTYCTNLQDAGVPINIAKELMGHSDISITSKIYTHHSDVSVESARNLINNNEACQVRAIPLKTIGK